VLVDRVWPRGLTKTAAPTDERAGTVAPSTQPRRWYGHHPSRFDEVRRHYDASLPSLSGRRRSAAYTNWPDPASAPC
jgi:uncharacterized protein YeaO (DUF488 family)